MIQIIKKCNFWDENSTDSLNEWGQKNIINSLSLLLPDCWVDLEHCMILDAEFELQDFV